MGVSLEKNIDQLKEIINSLQPDELVEVKVLLDQKTLEMDQRKRKSEILRELLLQGPTLSKEELEKISEARDLINKWRAE
ncbi:hypothetical protein SAMN00777080_4952 [Aquiflexum balticum DSM 16537]|uniref:Uncharacterized protein n=1 Tax=Aquiflexum balticum DSM 16537 TaxID=758820 RepID=A0A1W2HBU6_9BACT|nr:hypothetical protein [Aquiflexum balticum]SMD46271.1 hypothetical protein SAMN00777080_4952 [Aquiflexum balticum DSM 16537]